MSLYVPTGRDRRPSRLRQTLRVLLQLIVVIAVFAIGVAVGDAVGDRPRPLRATSTSERRVDVVTVTVGRQTATVVVTSPQP